MTPEQIAALRNAARAARGGNVAAERAFRAMVNPSVVILLLDKLDDAQRAAAGSSPTQRTVETGAWRR